MTEPQDDTQQYIAVLEAVVSVLAVKVGLNPEVMVSNAIQDVIIQTGMESAGTLELVQRRWSGRNVRASVLAAQTFVPAPIEEPQSVPESIEQPDMSSKLQAFKQRKSEANSEATVESDT